MSNSFLQSARTTHPLLSSYLETVRATMLATFENIFYVSPTQLQQDLHSSFSADTNYYPQEWWFLPSNRKSTAVIHYDHNGTRRCFTQGQLLHVCAALAKILVQEGCKDLLKDAGSQPIFIIRGKHKLSLFLWDLTLSLMGFECLFLFHKAPDSQLYEVCKTLKKARVCEDDIVYAWAQQALHAANTNAATGVGRGAKSEGEGRVHERYTSEPSEDATTANTSGCISNETDKHPHIFGSLNAHEPLRLLSTSGTTNTPKICKTGHAAVWRANWLSSACFFATTEGSAWCPLEPAWGAVALNATRNPLSFGQPMVVSETTFHVEHENTSFIIEDAQVKSLFITPFFLRGDCAKATPFAQVERVTIAGEKLSPQEQSNLKRIFPNALVINAYGNNESGCVSFIGCQQNGEAPLLLRPLPLTSYFTEDDGTLVLKNTQDSFWKGYIGRNAKHDPFCYVTGDKVIVHTKNQKNPLIEIVGRTDHAIKWKGQQFNTSDLTTELVTLAKAHRGFVVHLQTPHSRLVALLHGPQVTIEHLRDVIKKRWGSTLCDLHIIVLNTWPQTPGGKTDAAALTQKAQLTDSNP